MSTAELYYSGFAGILLFAIAGALFIGLTLFVSRLIRPHRPNAQKNATYESGESPVTSPWPQLSVRFYVVAFLFLLFEVELLFLFPWALVYADTTMQVETDRLWGLTSLVEMAIFVGLLLVGLAYVWINGHLNWISPGAKVTDYSSPVPKSLYDSINDRYKTK